MRLQREGGGWLLAGGQRSPCHDDDDDVHFRSQQAPVSSDLPAVLQRSSAVELRRRDGQTVGPEDRGLAKGRGGAAEPGVRSVHQRCFPHVTGRLMCCADTSYVTSPRADLKHENKTENKSRDLQQEWAELPDTETESLPAAIKQAAKEVGVGGGE